MTSSPYTVHLTTRAQKELDELRPHTARAARALRALEQDPHRGHPLKGGLSGARSLEFSLPGGAYRAAYIVDEELRECLVFMVGPHEGFYERAARRYAGLRLP